MNLHNSLNTLSSNFFMSTKTSSDLIVNRSTTRVHAPPGGATSWNLSSESDSKTASSGPAKSSVQNSTQPASSDQRVGIITASDTLALSEVATNHCKAQLNASGITNIIGIEVPSIGDLAYAASYLPLVEEDLSAIIAVGVHVRGDGQDSIPTVISEALLRVGLDLGLPVIPTVVSFASEAHAREGAQNLGLRSARSAYTLIRLRQGALEKPSSAGSVAIGPLTPARMAWAGTKQEEKKENPVQPLLRKLRQSLKERGARGIAGLARKFRIIDDDGSNSLDFNEFKKAMTEHALDFNEDELKMVFEYFDEDRSGHISYDEFLVGVRGELNERRKALVSIAFGLIDKDGNGILELEDIVSAYDASKHPDVISGKRTKTEIFREFLDTFDGGEKDGKVHPEEFERYYSNVSASIDDDDYFELMMRNAWHISGGEGWAANTTCKRVLVTHSDGTQSVQEVKNDLGMNPNDAQEIKRRLIQQGVDVVSVSLNGSVDEATPEAKTPAGTPRKRRGAGESSIVFG